MEGIAAEVADSAQRLSLVFGHHSLRRVLNDLYAVTAGDIEYGVHLTGDARVMDGNDRLCLFGDRVLDLVFVDIHSVGSDVDKHQLGAAQRKRVGGGAEGEGRQDDLVTGLDIQQQRCHLQRVGAGGGEQRFGGAGFFLQPGVTFLGEGAVAADLMIIDSLSQKVGFGAQKRRHIERYHNKSFLFFLIPMVAHTQIIIL